MAIDATAIERALDHLEPLVRAEPHYGDFLRHRARYASDVSVLSQVLDGSPVLEVGSFPGHFTALLKVLGVSCVSVDIAPHRLGVLGKHFQLDVRRCDIEREPLPFKNESLRYVVFSEVLEHLRVDPLFTLSELNRVMTSAGYLLLTTPNLYSVQQCLRFLSGRGFGDPLVEFMKLRAIGHMGHVREYSHRDVRRFLQYAGFQVQQVWYKHYYYGPGKRGLAKRLIFAVAPQRFRTFQVMLARKATEGPRLSPLP